MINSQRILVIILLFLTLSCQSKYAKINISDVTRNSRLILETSTKDPINIHLGFSGKINGTALITIYDGFGYKKVYEIESGKVDYNIDCDWYSRKCSIVYKPKSVSQGALILEYRFN
jgi:hypothetical protein